MIHLDLVLLFLEPPFIKEWKTLVRIGLKVCLRNHNPFQEQLLWKQLKTSFPGIFSALYSLPFFFFSLPFSILIRAFAMETRLFAASEVICSCCSFPSPHIISHSVNRRCCGAEQMPPPRNGNGTAAPGLCLPSAVLP